MAIKVYEVNGVWNTYDYWHNECGYTFEPTVATSYKSASYDTWGTAMQSGYFGEGDLYDFMSLKFWASGVYGWFGPNEMALEGLYPANADDTVLVKDGVASDGVFVSDLSENTYYLMRNEIEEGWIEESELESHGWQVPSYIVVDDTTGKIIGGGASPFVTLGISNMFMEDVPMSTFSTNYVVLPDGGYVVIEEISQ